MKIEKLTENKIRVIVGLDDLLKNNININASLIYSLKFQNFFLDILKKAEKENGFYTNDCKLLIEFFTFSDEIVIFTITKCSSIIKDQDTFEKKNKKLIVRRKTYSIKKSNSIYIFKNFESFCELCNSLEKINMKKICKNSILYLYKNTYYLAIKNIDIDCKELNPFFSKLSEFAVLSSFSNNFESKLLEHGKTVIKTHAIETGIQYFKKA